MSKAGVHGRKRGFVSGGAREIEVRRGENMDRMRDYR